MLVLSGLTLNNFMDNYLYIFIIAVITFVLTVLLRALTLTALQSIFILLYSLVMNEIILVTLSVLQIVIAILTLYKLFMAIHMNYLLVLEKTFQIRPDLLKTEHRGSQFSFWHTK